MLFDTQSKNASHLLEKIETADAILVGAAAGMSAACGFNFFYQNDSYFQKYLSEFHEKYGFTGAFNGFYYRYPSSEARWAFLARMCYMEYECETGKPYYDLMALLAGKNYHIMTTNQDFQFTRVVPEEKLSAIQGDSRYFQCSRRCHDEIFYNKDMIYAMNDAIDENLCIPTELIPRCPQCGAELEPWVRGYTFLEGEKYRDEYRKRYQYGVLQNSVCNRRSQALNYQKNSPLPILCDGIQSFLHKSFRQFQHSRSIQSQG